jgi:hypothetical protein
LFSRNWQNLRAKRLQQCDLSEGRGEGYPAFREDQLTTIPICTHIKADGICCCSPALRGHSRCYFHRKLFYRDKPRRQPTLPPRTSSGVLYTFQRLEAYTADEALTRQGMIEVLKQAERAMRRHIQNIKRDVQRPDGVRKHYEQNA